ncbi:MAG TPA: hypothetical protein PKW90_06940 [Myxococcota bacterium]|nr:hypothetical protein [Myxococcota bacterium]
MPQSRRSFLATGLTVAMLGTAGVALVRLPAADPGRRVLSAQEALVVEALGEALFPAGSPIGISAADVDIVSAVDELLGEYLEPVVADVFRHTLQVLEAGTLASRGTRFSLLPLEQRRVVVETWGDPGLMPRRMASDALRLVMGMSFFNVPAVRRSLGWVPPCGQEAV